MVSKKLIVLCVVLACAGPMAPAAAHGDIQATEPGARSSVRRAPRTVAITFTEAPTRQAVLEVTDGCNRAVGQGVDVNGATATVRLATGQPGKWQVSYRVISSLDGHQTRGGYAFTVAGKRDCTPDRTTPAPDDDATQAAPRDDREEAEGSGAPVVPIALGAAGIILVALLLRRAGSG